MKVKLLFLSLFLGVLISNVQKVDAQLKFGAKVAVDVADHHINTKILNSSNRVGIQFGGTMEVMAPILGLGVEASLLYGHKEYDAKSSVTGVSLPNRDYLMLPVDIKKRFKIIPPLGIFIQAGPYIAEGFGNRGLKGVADDVRAKNFEAGVNAGVGLTLLKHVDLGLYYRCALTDSYATKNPNLANLSKKRYQSWSLGLTYFF